MPASKRTRFEVFKRDSFTCQYCGRKPPAVVLQCDHIIAASNGGRDGQDNLVTSCADCNQGKSNVPLDQAPDAIASRLEQITEAREQMRAYTELLNQIEEETLQSLTAVDSAFSSTFKGSSLTPHFLNGSVRNFIKQLPTPVVVQAMQLACSKFDDDADKATAYFCGICWRTIKGDGPVQRR